MEFKRICAHEHAGRTYVLAEIESEAPAILWEKDSNETTPEQANRIAENLADRYGVGFGCNLPYELHTHYATGGSHASN